MRTSFLKYSLLFFVLFAAGNLHAGDKYGFKFIESKVYKGKTDKWIYEIYKNDEVYKTLNVYVSDTFNATRILVNVNYDNSQNRYIFVKSESVNNFRDMFRLTESTVSTLKEAVNLAVDHYLADQIINKE